MTSEPNGVLVQLRKGVLEYCVLASLRAEPAYSVELASRLARHSALFASAGTLYPLLSRLRKLGRVDTYWQESPQGPPRQYYQLSPDGHMALAAFEAAWFPFSEDVHAVLQESKS